jgi:DNA polymerase I-like protein with 3'-5' exonuclease and polymerase domains
LDGIQKYRGSILQNIHSGIPKVIASMHPASLLHAEKEMQNWKVLQYIKFDFIRAAQQSLFRDIRLPQRSLAIARNSLDVIRFFERSQHLEYMSRDVETCRTIPLCLGFAATPYDAISVPLLNDITATNPDGIPLHDQLHIWRIVAQFMGDTRVKLVEQNGKFDDRICAGVKLPGTAYFDTMLAWHVLFLEMPKSLAFITSILTDEPYYKDEGKEYNPKKDKFDRLLLYNAKDAAVTIEIQQKEIPMLREFDLEDFFWNRTMPLHKLYMDIEQRGILIDKEIRKELAKKYDSKKEEVHTALLQAVAERTGLPLGEIDVNVNSSKQVHKLLYQLLGCPLRKDTAENTLQALANNTLKDEPRKNVIKHTLAERKIRKTISTYIRAPLSDDGRIRTQFKITGTETGRTSTEKCEPPIVVTAEGMALQTLTKYGEYGGDLRRMFVPDPGYVFVEADGAQAEDRVVAVLSKDWDALKELNRTEFKYNEQGLKDDRHTKTAILISNKFFEEITDLDRQSGKRTRHAANYDVGKHQLMETLAGEGIFVSEWRTGKYLDKIHEANPNIRGVYHRGIEEILATSNCVLTTPFERRRQFFNKWGRDLFKEAYAYIPQSTVSDQVKFAMLRIRAQWYENPFIMESHDSFLALLKLEHLQKFCKLAKREMETSIDFSRCSLPRDYQLVIPADFKVGRTSWLEMEKYSVLD